MESTSGAAVQGCVVCNGSPGCGRQEFRADEARFIIESVVCSALGVNGTELRAGTRKSAPVAFARQVAMYLAHVGCGMSLRESAALFNRDRTTAAHACCIVEDRRDDPAFDGFMDHLECAVACLLVPARGFGLR